MLFSNVDVCHQHYWFHWIEKCSYQSIKCPKHKKKLHKIKRVHKSPPEKIRSKSDTEYCGTSLKVIGVEEDFHHQARTERFQNTKKVKYIYHRANTHKINTLQGIICEFLGNNFSSCILITPTPVVLDLVRERLNVRLTATKEILPPSGQATPFSQG